MKVKDLIAKLKEFPKDSEVVVQSWSESEWGGFDVRSDVQSVVKRTSKGEKVTLIRCCHEWRESGGYS